MNSPPPPPPPHGANPKSTSGGLPPGKYDIFIIPEHSAGSGFLYLPSLKPNVNSFAAGFASALIVVLVGTAIAPAVQAWWNSVKGAGGAGMILLILAVGVGAWALGRIQTDGGPGPGGGSGAGPGAGGASSSGAHHGTQSSHSNGYAGGPPPNTAPPPGAGPMPGSGPMPGANGGPKPGAWQRPESQPGAAGASADADGAAKSAWEKAQEETKRKEDEKRTREAEAKRKAELEKRLKELREREARERAAREQKLREEGERAAREKIRKEQEARDAIRKEEEERQARRRREEEERRKEEEARQARIKREEEERQARIKREEEEREAKRRKDDEEREAKKKQEEEAREAKKKEDEARLKRLKDEADRLRRRREFEEREKKRKEEAAKKAEAAKLDEEKPKTSSYAFSAVGEKTSLWPKGRPPSPTKAAPPPVNRPPVTPTPTPPSPTKRPPAPTAKTYKGTEDDTHSYRPYDRPKKPLHKKSLSSLYSESSYAASQSTSRTTPPPSHRGPYTTKDPDKIVIKAVYSFNNAFIKTPTSQLVSGVGSVTDGLILRITTEGLFIDDDVRGVPQREWDVKAWTMKLVEVWCPSFRQGPAGVSASARVASDKTKNPSSLRRLWGLDKDKPQTSEETDALLVQMLALCKNNCRVANSYASSAYSESSYDSRSSYASDSAYGSSAGTNDRRGQTGENKTAKLHVLRASIRDQEGKKYVFIIGEEESWKVSVGLQRLRKGTQVRALGVSGMSSSDAKGTLENLGWIHN